MEIFRAMDIPFVVNQWWAAICGAKRMTRKYFGLMQENGYRPDLNSYDAQALAESFDPDDKKVDADGNPMGPWGGLPTPTISITRLTGDVQSKIFGLLAENYGADLYVIENTIARTTPLNWYELAADRRMMVEVEHPQRGKVKLPGFAPRFSEVEIDYQCSPALGGANEEIYGGLLGLSAEELALLKEHKAI